MTKKYHLTNDGKRELEAELSELVGRRSEIASKIANARDYGDISENAEYDAAKELQGQVESRIGEIEDILRNMVLIKASTSNKVEIGSQVELKTNGNTVSYTLVGPVEADPLEGRISNESPIGLALLGKKVGELVTIQTPKGATEYQVVKLG